MCLLGVMTFDLNLINHVTGGGYLVNFDFFVLQFYYNIANLPSDFFTILISFNSSSNKFDVLYCEYDGFKWLPLSNCLLLEHRQAKASGGEF